MIKSFNEIEKRSIFKALASKSQIQVGREFGFEKWCGNNMQILNAVNKIYREVKENPAQFSVPDEMLEMVEKGMEARRTSGKNTTLEVFKSLEDIDEKSLVLGAKKKAWVLLNKKLDSLAKNKGAFNKESLMSLGKLAGIVFDKAQIVSGEATEHIMLKSKIDTDKPSEELVSQLLTLREGHLKEVEA